MAPRLVAAKSYAILTVDLTPKALKYDSRAGARLIAVLEQSDLGGEPPPNRGHT
jgi:hypothetical protein